MQVILQGSLAHFSVAELLPLLVSHKHGGTLELERSGKRTRVFLRDGMVDWSESSDGIAAEEAILDLFTWEDGMFVLFDEMTLPAGAAALDLDATVLIEEGIRRAKADKDIASWFRPEQTFRVTDDPGVQSAISLTPDEFKILFRIGQGRSLGDLCTDLDRPPAELYPTIRVLQTNGLIEETETAVPPSLGSSGSSEPAPPEELRGTPPAADMTFHLQAPEAAATQVTPLPAPSSPATSTGIKRGTLVGSLITQGADESVHPLLDDEYVIGRDRASAIVLSDGSVSSRHARIVRMPEGFVLEDLQSRNGTFVNGERISGPRPLADKDVIRFGRVVLTFNLAAETRVGEKTRPDI